MAESDVVATVSHRLMPININSATAAELMTIPQIGDSRSSNILALRESYPYGLSPQILADNGVLSVQFWTNSHDSNIVSFEMDIAEKTPKVINPNTSKFSVFSSADSSDTETERKKKVPPSPTIQDSRLMS